MTIPIFLLPEEERRKLGDILKDENKLGLDWTRCDIIYNKVIIWLSILVLSTFGISLLVYFNHESILWLAVITIASLGSLVYLVILVIWIISGRRLEFVINDTNIYQIKNMIVRKMAIKDILDHKMDIGSDQITITGYLLFSSGKMKYRFVSRYPANLNSFMGVLASKLDKCKNSEVKSSINNLAARISYSNGIFKWIIIVIAFIGCGIYLTSYYPSIIDEQNYQISKKVNTATSYRQYLKDPLNKKYRGNVIGNIKTLYDQYIERLSKKTASSISSNIMKDLLLYVRDSSQYEVPIVFESSSELNDLTEEKLNIKSVKDIFDQTRRKELEGSVIKNIKNAFKGIFPSDIMSINDGSPIPEQAFFRIAYIYQNDDSIYYNTKEKNKSFEQRELFQGIKIHWEITLNIPGKGFINIARIDSTPAPEFEVAGDSNSTSIYSRMAETAFSDVTNKLEKLIL